MSDIEAAATALRQRLQGVDWLMVQLALIAAFHGLIALTLLAAPEPQVLTAGTRPVLELVDGLSVTAHRLGWAVIYGAAALLLLATWLDQSVARQWAAWLTAIPMGFVWAGAFGIALIDGEGSAIGLAIWVVLLSWWGTVAVAIGVREPVPRER